MDVVRFIVDVVRFVVDARAELFCIMCISQNNNRSIDFLKTNLKMREVDRVTNITTMNTKYRHYSCATYRTVPYRIRRTATVYCISCELG